MVIGYRLPAEVYLKDNFNSNGNYDYSLPIELALPHRKNQCKSFLNKNSFDNFQNLNIISIHSPAGWLDADYWKYIISFGIELGIKEFIIHPSHIRETQLATAQSQWLRTLEKIKSNFPNINLIIETMQPTKLRVFIPESIIENDLLMCLDVSHTGLPNSLHLVQYNNLKTVHLSWGQPGGFQHYPIDFDESPIEMFQYLITLLNQKENPPIIILEYLGEYHYLYQEHIELVKNWINPI